MLVLTFPPKHGLQTFRAFDHQGNPVDLARIEIMPVFSSANARAACCFGDVWGSCPNNPVHSFSLKLSGRTGLCQLLSQAEDVVPGFLAANGEQPDDDGDDDEDDDNSARNIPPADITEVP